MKRSQSQRISLIAAAATLALGSAAQAAVILTGNYSENFNTLPTSGTVTGAFSGTNGVQSGIPGLLTWEGTKISGSSATASNFDASAGAATAGGLYTYGAASAADRALGALASSTRAMSFGVELVNNTGSAISNPVISFDREVWRIGDTENGQLAFSYGLSGGTITSSDYLTSTAMTAFPALNATGLSALAAAAANGNSNALLVTSAVPVTIPANSSLFIRWNDNNSAGNDSGIAVDNFAIVVPEPTSMALLSLGGLALVRRRRN